MMLRNSFYYGEFEYPIGGGNWYKGKHTPLVSKEIFDKVNKQLITYPKSTWGGKIIAFKGLFKCGNCGRNIVGEEKWRKRKWAEPVKHVYYHCSRQKDYDCPEPYVTEDKLIKELLRYIQFTSIAHPQTIKYTDKLKYYFGEYKKTREMILLEQDINPDHKPLDIQEYSKYALRSGSLEEKKVLIKAVGRQLYIKNQFISSCEEEIN